MNIALIAHDNKKRLMENLCVAYRHILSRHRIYATGTTGQIIEDATNLPVSKYLAGHLGGEQQLSAQVALNDIDMVIFLRDPLHPKHYEPDINSLLQLCDVHNIPVASNLATAEVILLALDRGDLDWRLNLKR
jgi:methylglyoxal synthase